MGVDQILSVNLSKDKKLAFWINGYSQSVYSSASLGILFTFGTAVNRIKKSGFGRGLPESAVIHRPLNGSIGEILALRVKLLGTGGGLRKTEEISIANLLGSGLINFKHPTVSRKKHKSCILGLRE